jgi:FkbM family methyltransferase
MIIIIVSLMLYFKYFLLMDKNMEIFQDKLNIIDDEIKHENPQIINKIFDLTKPPTDDYKYIPCRLSKSINNVITTLCVHEITKDGWVSSSIWKYGVWEENIVTNVLYSLSKNPESLFLDIGAQVGEYSLYAAKLGCDVLTVEPFYDNIMRIHKAAFNESLGDKITLIKNAISNRRGEIKLLKKRLTNIGGQSLIENKNRNFTKDDMLNQNDINSKYFVETILFDDIVYNLPLNKDGREYTTAIMKIDIESFEPYAFQYASKLFDTLKILVIYMEWGNYLYRAINRKSL